MIYNRARVGAPRIATALRTGTLVPAPVQPANTNAGPVAVPRALRAYAVEAPDLARYDALGTPAEVSA